MLVVVSVVKVFRYHAYSPVCVNMALRPPKRLLSCVRILWSDCLVELASMNGRLLAIVIVRLTLAVTW